MEAEIGGRTSVDAKEIRKGLRAPRAASTCPPLSRLKVPGGRNHFHRVFLSLWLTASSAEASCHFYVTYLLCSTVQAIDFLTAEIMCHSQEMVQHVSPNCIFCRLVWICENKTQRARGMCQLIECFLYKGKGLSLTANTHIKARYRDTHLYF